MKKIVLISAFQPSKKFGGGYVTELILRYFSVENIFSRNDNELKIFRNIRTIISWVTTPFLHPIFCCYAPKFNLGNNEKIILNFSQTFSLLFKFKKIDGIIVHDVIAQKRFFFRHWIFYSEKLIFSRARVIYVLSSKDSRLIRRFYNIPASKIISLNEVIFPIDPFSKNLIRVNKWKILFLGSLDRYENYISFKWFYELVFPECCNAIDITVIGQNNAVYDFPNVKFLGFVESLELLLPEFDLSIAPIISGAGLKIKVYDVLRLGVPLLGTYKAYEGFKYPSDGFISNDPKKWIDLLNSSNLSFRYT
jgi:hypothetical protein